MLVTLLITFLFTLIALLITLLITLITLYFLVIIGDLFVDVLDLGCFYVFMFVVVVVWCAGKLRHVDLRFLGRFSCYCYYFALIC